jgi:putative tryptophan/tyrosine transport system substrate-binding protein
MVVLGPFAASLLAAPLAGEAQQRGKVPRIGFIEAGASSTNSHFLEAFRQGLRELGYVEGQNITVEDRWADGRSERFPALLDELIRLNVDVIVQASTPGALAAKRATSRVPVVFWGVGDPVAVGLVASLGHPGGNVTGLALGTGDGFGGKWVELLRETLPHVSHAGLLLNPEARGLERVETEVTTGGARLGLNFDKLSVRSLEDLDGAFAAATKARLGGLIVITDPLTLRHRARIVQLASHARLPTVYSFGEFARAGGLMAYGPSVTDLARRAAIYVDKILKGAKPGDLPVEEPTKFELIVNLKTAKALGLTIPPSVLARADQVIE